MNPDNCDDCVLKQLEESDLDTCGGIEVADGNADDGTTYRYIAGGKISRFSINNVKYIVILCISGLFPYTLQCYRGDLSMSKRLNNSGNWAVFTVNNSCGQGGGAENGCTVFNQVRLLIGPFTVSSHWLI